MERPERAEWSASLPFPRSPSAIDEDDDGEGMARLPTPPVRIVRMVEEVVVSVAVLVAGLRSFVRAVFNVLDDTVW